MLKAGGKHWLRTRMEQGLMCLEQRSGGEKGGSEAGSKTMRTKGFMQVLGTQ